VDLFYDKQWLMKRKNGKNAVKLLQQMKLSCPVAGHGLPFIKAPLGYCNTFMFRGTVAGVELSMRGLICTG
jgi:hypothetical protein